jgi:hypothetical protein
VSLYILSTTLLAKLPIVDNFLPAHPAILGKYYDAKEEITPGNTFPKKCIFN